LAVRYFSFFWVALRPSCDCERLDDERPRVDELLDDLLRPDELFFEFPELELLDLLRLDFLRLEPPDLLFCCAMPLLSSKRALPALPAVPTMGCTP
jgi:hypothetical protein